MQNDYRTLSLDTDDIGLIVEGLILLAAEKRRAAGRRDAIGANFKGYRARLRAKSRACRALIDREFPDFDHIGHAMRGSL